MISDSHLSIRVYNALIPWIPLYFILFIKFTLVEVYLFENVDLMEIHEFSLLLHH